MEPCKFGRDRDRRSTLVARLAATPYGRVDVTAAVPLGATLGMAEPAPPAQCSGFCHGLPASQNIACQGRFSRYNPRASLAAVSGHERSAARRVPCNGAAALARGADERAVGQRAQRRDGQDRIWPGVAPSQNGFLAGHSKHRRGDRADPRRRGRTRFPSAGHPWTGGVQLIGLAVYPSAL